MHKQLFPVFVLIVLNRVLKSVEEREEEKRANNPKSHLWHRRKSARKAIKGDINLLFLMCVKSTASFAVHNICLAGNSHTKQVSYQRLASSWPLVRYLS